MYHGTKHTYALGALHVLLEEKSPDRSKRFNTAGGPSPRHPLERVSGGLAEGGEPAGPRSGPAPCASEHAAVSLSREPSLRGAVCILHTSCPLHSG